MKKERRQAVVIIHGIGEQRPMETLRAFVAGALCVEQAALDKFVFSKPDRISDTLELRRLSASTRRNVRESPLDEDCATDFYELYWQHLMQGTSGLHVWPWVLDLLHRRKLNPRLRLIRRQLVGFLLLGFAAITALGAVAWLYLGSSPLWGWAEKPVILSLSLAAVLGWLGRRSFQWLLLGRAERFLLGYVGDAARYLTPDPPNIQARRDIRTAGLTLLRKLHEDELRRYERIIVVGHSLGSVIAYDLITWFWQEQHHRMDLEYCTGKRETAVMAYAEPESPDQDKSPLEELARPSSSRTDDFANSQRALWRKSREQNHLPWRITDLVTLGSPLAHADVLLAESEKAFADGKMQREFPTCPPQEEDPRDVGLLGRKYDEGGCTHYVHILHHGAPFAVTRWTNLYFPGDIIGGPVAGLFGEGIKDVCISPNPEDVRLAYSPRSHTRYWDAGQKKACRELCEALQLNEDGRPLTKPI